MKSKKNYDRRDLFKLGAGLLTTAVATSSKAQILCGSATPRQPLGPFFPKKDTPVYPVRENTSSQFPLALASDNDLTQINGKSGKAAGTYIEVSGQLTDKNCQPIENATIVIWQASEAGRYNHIGDSANEDFVHPQTGEILQRAHDENFQYWGKAETNEHGLYKFLTVLPGFYPANLEQGWYRPPHIHFLISAMGHPQHVTQMYFDCPTLRDNDFIQSLNTKDSLLQSVPEQQESLIVLFQPKTNDTQPRNSERKTRPGVEASSLKKQKSQLLAGTFNIQLP